MRRPVAIGFGDPFVAFFYDALGIAGCAGYLHPRISWTVPLLGSQRSRKEQSLYSRRRRYPLAPAHRRRTPGACSAATKLRNGKRGDSADSLIDGGLSRCSPVRTREHRDGIPVTIWIGDHTNLVADPAQQTPTLRLHRDLGREAGCQPIAGLLPHQPPHLGAGGGGRGLIPPDAAQQAGHVAWRGPGGLGGVQRAALFQPLVALF